LMNELIQNLINESLVKKCMNIDSEIAKQKSSYQQLLKRAETTDLQVAYLANYDALLRLVEIYLLSFGFTLSDQPHSAARKLIGGILPNSNFAELIKTRHEVKKSDAIPKKANLRELLEVRQNFDEWLHSSGYK
jgi:hypothetical protein